MPDTSLLPAYTAIGISALLPIYYGSKASLQMPKRAKKAVKALQPDKDIDEYDNVDEIERVTSREAYLFPILGSCTLLGLFLAFKYLDKNLINKILSAYFALIGTFGLSQMISWISRQIFSRERFSSADEWKLELTKGTVKYLTCTFSNLDLAVLPFSMALTGFQTYTNNWIASNVLGLALAFNGISFLKLDSFATGAIVLAGLFFYDIYWVFYSSKTFGQSVMVAVATNFEAPIKIVFPKDFLKPASSGFTMLGLGDIVIPGIFIALALRFDYNRAVDGALAKLTTGSSIPTPRDRFPKPYFRAVLVSYILGLTTTIYVMHTFKAAQPALLYLSPACLLSVLTVALFRGEVRACWNYVDGEDEHDEVKKSENGEIGSDDEKNGPDAVKGEPGNEGNALGESESAVTAGSEEARTTSRRRNPHTADAP